MLRNSESIVETVCTHLKVCRLAPVFTISACSVLYFKKSRTILSCLNSSTVLYKTRIPYFAA